MFLPCIKCALGVGPAVIAKTLGDGGQTYAFATYPELLFHHNVVHEIVNDAGCVLLTHQKGRWEIGNLTGRALFSFSEELETARPWSLLAKLLKDGVVSGSVKALSICMHDGKLNVKLQRF